ncbi:unnamed protein product [Rhodiola kirilowii]
MTILAWNCRGVGNPRSIRELRSLVQTTRPQILGLIETKVGKERLERLRIALGFAGCFVVPALGTSGGLTLFWKKETDVSIQSFSFYHIDFLISDNQVVRYTLFYGSPEAHMRRYSWNLLRQLSGNSQLPWCVFGDFNDILCKSDVSRFSSQRARNMMAFRRVVSDCGLSDIGYQGYKFTYSNKRKGSQECKSMLDRVLASRSWLRLFPDVQNRHIYTYSSDHMALCLHFDVREKPTSNQFRFENMWLRDEKFMQLVDNTCQEASERNLSYADRLKLLQQKLSQWNKHHFGNVQAKVKKVRDELEMIYKQPRDDVSQQRETINLRTG